MSARVGDVTFFAYTPGWRAGIASPELNGWYVTAPARDERGRPQDKRLSGPWPTAAQAQAVARSLASKETP